MLKKIRVLRYLIPATNPSEKLTAYGITFGYDREMKPIPQEVPEDIARILLEKMTVPCRCHYKKPKPLFEEVV